MPQYFQVAVMSSGQKPIATPSIKNLEAEPGQAIRFTAAFDVMPEFELGDYKSIKVEKPVVEVTDEEVQTEISSLQERQATTIRWTKTVRFRTETSPRSPLKRRRRTLKSEIKKSR